MRNTPKIWLNDFECFAANEQNPVFLGYPSRSAKRQNLVPECAERSNSWAEGEHQKSRIHCFHDVGKIHLMRILQLSWKTQGGICNHKNSHLTCFFVCVWGKQLFNFRLYFGAEVWNQSRGIPFLSWFVTNCTDYAMKFVRTHPRLVGFNRG